MNKTIDRNLKAFGLGPNSKARSWNMYFVNGYKFHPNTWTRGKKINKTVVCMLKVLYMEDKMTFTV